MIGTEDIVQLKEPVANSGAKKWMSVADALKLAHDHLKANRLAAAEKVARDIIEARGGNADAHHILGVISFKQNKIERAIKSIERAIELAPNTAGFYANIAEMYRQRGQAELGLTTGEKAISLDPHNAQAWNNLGIIYFDRGNFERSAECYRKAVSVQENFSHAWNNLGNSLVRLDRDAEAHVAFSRAITLKADYSESMVNDGLCFREEGELELARERFEQAIQSNPKNANARVSLAILHMLQGNYPRGLGEYEWRLALPEIRRSNLPGQPWRGEPIEGKRLFIYSEQGLGDTIQYVRYLALVMKRHPASIVFQVQPGLQRLVEANFPDVEVVRNVPAADTVDVHCALMSLPALMRLPVIPDGPQSAYLTAPADQTEAFRQRFAPYSGLKIGLAWAGNTNHKYDYSRSMAGDFLMPLLGLPGCNFFSLQIGNKSVDAPLIKAGMIDLSKDVSNMSATAAAISALDLVIAVDTSLAHLAGAVGTPVWTLLAAVPDWRWGLSKSTTNLYASMRLFRQPARRDWGSVIEQLAAALADQAAVGLPRSV